MRMIRCAEEIEDNLACANLLIQDARAPAGLLGALNAWRGTLGCDRV